MEEKTKNCISTLNLPMDHKCVDFLDRYWSGMNVTTEKDAYLYNLCDKRMINIFKATFTHEFSKSCQIKYFDMLCRNCTSQLVLGKKRGQGLKNFLEIQGPGHYFPIILAFAAFSLGGTNPLYINYKFHKEYLSPFVVAAWHELDLIKSEKDGAKNYFIWWKKKAKILNICTLLTKNEIDAEYEIVVKLSSVNQLTSYIKRLLKNLLNGYYTEDKSDSITLIQSILLGYIIRNITNKTEKMFTYNQTEQFIEDFVTYTGNSVIENSLKNFLLTICRSKFSKNIIESRKLELEK